MVHNNDILMMYFQGCLNLPYRWGGNNPVDGFDCSGFVQEALAVIGKDPVGDQTSHGLYEIFKLDGVTKKNASFGDLLFFGNEHKIKHVAIALNETTMIEAGGGSSRVTDLENAIKYNAFVRVRPISRRSDLVAVIEVM